MLEPFAKDVFTTARPGRFLGIETGSRMAVVRLSDGGLFVHSPVLPDAATRQAVDELGPVRAVVAPSLFHNLHVAAWMEAYPDAHVAACPGLEWRRPRIPFHFVTADEPHASWRADLEQVYFSARRENEVVFFHRASRTLICADALLHISKHPDRLTRAVARLMGNREPGTGWAEWFMIRNRELARRQVDRILAWDIEGIVLSHGPMVRQGGREVVRHAYTWL
jgi:hypothetical protein